MELKNPSLNKTMPLKNIGSTRVSAKTFSNMQSALTKWNSESFPRLNEQDFRRISFELLSWFILSDKKLPIEIKF